MNDTQQRQLGATLWTIADKLRGAMNPDDFRDYMLSFLFLRYLSDNYEEAAKKELGSDYTQCEAYINKVKSAKDNKDASASSRKNVADLLLGQEESEAILKKTFATDREDASGITVLTPLSVWYAQNPSDAAMFEKQMRRKLHYVIKPDYL